MEIRYEKIEGDSPVVAIYQIDRDTFFVDTFSNGFDLSFDNYRSAKDYAIAVFNRAMRNR